MSEITENDLVALRDNLAGRAQAAFSSLSRTGRTKHRIAWKRIERRILTMTPEPAEAYEFYRAVAYARGLYLADLAQGMPADMCEKRTLAMYTR